MKNGMSKANTVEVVQAIDLIGMTLCLAQQNKEPMPAEVEASVILMLGEIRRRIADSYGLNINPINSVFGDPIRENCTPADVADEILRDLDNDPFGR